MEQGKFGFYLDPERGTCREGGNRPHRAPCALLVVSRNEHLQNLRVALSKATGARQRDLALSAAHIEFSVGSRSLKPRVAPVHVVAAVSVVKEHLLVPSPRVLWTLQQQSFKISKAIGKRSGR